MEIKAILESLEKAGAVDDLLTLAPVVGPGAVISNNLEWSSMFTIGRTAFYKGEYEFAAQTFYKLDECLPEHEKYLTPAKINETFCWLYLGKLSDYRLMYENLVKEDKVYGVVLWNFIVACYRMGLEAKAELYLKLWFKSASPPFLIKGLLLISILQFHEGRLEEAMSSFSSAWKSDQNYCKQFMQKYNIPMMEETSTISEGLAQTQAIKENQIIEKEEVLSALQELLVPHAPSKYPQIAQQLSEYEYQFGYIVALEKFGDGDVDEALRYIEHLLKGTRENGALLWAKTDCLLAKRQWREGIALIEDQLNDVGLPGGVLWNATCAYFNLDEYGLALSAIIKCVDLEYRNSSIAWLVQGLLAHLCGKNDLRTHAIREAIILSPKQSINYLGLLKQIGIDLERLSSHEMSPTSKVDDEKLMERYHEVVKNAIDLLNRGSSLEAAKLFLQLAPESIAYIPEKGDINFKPVFLPTCPAKLYDYKEIFLAGVAAFQRKAYDEGILKFEDLYLKTDRSYEATVNLAASLIASERYSRAIDILVDSIKNKKSGGSYAIRNIVSAYMRSDKPEEAFPWFSRLLEVSQKEYFNFVQMAYVAELLGRKEDAATALFNECTMTLTEPSIQLQAAAVKACLEVKDYDRSVALVKYFVKEIPSPYVVAGATRPIMPAKDCIRFSPMNRQYKIFSGRHDARAAVGYFHEVYLAREADYVNLINIETIDSLFNACRFYGLSLFDNKEFEKGSEILRQAYNVLLDHAAYYPPKELSKRYSGLTQVYYDREHYFWALELCKKGLEADSNNKILLNILKKIEEKISNIPERSRKAVKELNELPLSKSEKMADFVGLLPKVTSLIEMLSQDSHESKKVIRDLGNLINDVIKLDTIQIIDRKKEIARQRETTARIERDLQLYLPQTFFSALVPVLRGIRKTWDEVQAKSICPEFTLLLEPISYYRENEASLLFKLRNTGATDVNNLRMKVKDIPNDNWAPAIEERYFEIVKKDELLWVDWPINTDIIPEPESRIKIQISLIFTGGNLGGEFVEQFIGDLETKLVPFIDISVDYPVVALKPIERNKLYGREELLRTLKSSFTRSRQGRIPFLEGVRKVGKTSIFYFLANRITDPILPVYINLETDWINPYQFFAIKINEEISKQKKSEPFDISRIITKDDFERFLQGATRRTGIEQIVLLLDEFHALVDRIDKGSLRKDFLGDLRDLYQNPKTRISVAFADWYRVDELKSRCRAQLWADFACETISFLNKLDTREAILSPVQGSQVRLGPDVVSRIYYWTNGYPWHIQWICSELINHLNTQKRYTAIPQDIDLLAKKLLREDRLFNEGVCRPERISQELQCTIYGILDTLQESGGDIGTWFDREIALSMKLRLDIKYEIAKLVTFEVLQEQEGQIQFCSRLHAKWLDDKRRKGSDIYGKICNITDKNNIQTLNPPLHIHQEAGRPKEQEELKPYSTQYLSLLENEIFKLFSSVYQKLRKEGASEVNSKTLESLKYKLLELTTSSGDIRWLDVGCGDGRCLEVLDAIRKRESIKYHGIDGVHRHLDEAIERAQGYGLQDLKIEKMGAETMKFDSEYDIVSAVLLFHEIDPLYLPLVLKNMLHALKENGIIVISDFQEPYERENKVVVWTAEDIENILEGICREARINFEPIKTNNFSDEFGFYRGYIKKSEIDEDGFKKFMLRYGEFLEAKKEHSKQKRETLRTQIRDRVCAILARSDIDSKSISEEEMKKIKEKIEDAYIIKAYKVDLLTSEIEFLDDKIDEFRKVRNIPHSAVSERLII